MANRINTDNGTIELDEKAGHNHVGIRILYPCYWDEDTNGWKDYDFANDDDLTTDDKTWINDNFTTTHKDKFKLVFGAGKE